MPARRAAHRESSDDDSILVDRIALLDALQRLEEIHLARELARVAEAAVEMTNDRVGGAELAGGFQPALEEPELGERLVAPVQPEVQTMLVVAAGLVGRRDNQAVRLEGPVDL